MEKWDGGRWLEKVGYSFWLWVDGRRVHVNATLKVIGRIMWEYLNYEWSKTCHLVAHRTSHTVQMGLLQLLFDSIQTKVGDLCDWLMIQEKN